MPHPLPLVSIITVNYNGEQDTLELVSSLKEGAYSNWELFIVDNNSREKAERLASLDDSRITFIPLNTNLGFAGGNNAAVEHCKGEYYFFVNNDTVLEPNCLKTLVETAAELKTFGALSPKFHYYHHKNLIEFAGCTQINPITARNRALHHKELDTGVTGVIETHYAHGAGMLIPKEVIEKVGLMHADYFLYYEEMDWCERIRKAGYKIYCQRDALIHHKESASVGKLNPIKTYYLNRNRILFMKRNYLFPKNIPFILFLIFISFPINLVRFLVKGDTLHLKAYMKGVFWHINPNLRI